MVISCTRKMSHVAKIFQDVLSCDYSGSFWDLKSKFTSIRHPVCPDVFYCEFLRL